MPLPLHAVLPGLRDPGENGAGVSIRGHAVNVVNPATPAARNLIIPLLREVVGRFPSGSLQLGCDELPPAIWAGSPRVAEVLAREAPPTRDGVPGRMMARTSAYLMAHGITPAACEDAAKGAIGGIGHGAAAVFLDQAGARLCRCPGGARCGDVPPCSVSIRT